MKFSFKGEGEGWGTRPPFSEFSGSAPGFHLVVPVIDRGRSVNSKCFIKMKRKLTKCGIPKSLQYDRRIPGNRISWSSKRSDCYMEDRGLIKRMNQRNEQITPLGEENCVCPRPP